MFTTIPSWSCGFLESTLDWRVNPLSARARMAMTKSSCTSTTAPETAAALHRGFRRFAAISEVNRGRPHDLESAVLAWTLVSLHRTIPVGRFNVLDEQRRGHMVRKNDAIPVDRVHMLRHTAVAPPSALWTSLQQTPLYRRLPAIVSASRPAHRLECVWRERRS
jgi:hypothetical protein